MTTPEPFVLRHDADGVATLTLNRPASFNALSAGMLAALQSAFDTVHADRSVRVVVLAANGRGFCAGHDLKEFNAMTGTAPMQALFEQCSRLMLTLTRLAQPVIARVHGVATAAGCQLVATCDLAIASEDARFGTPGVNIGGFCSTPAVALGRAVARKHAMEMLLTGQLISAQRAYEMGLISQVVPPAALDGETTRWARLIASKSASAIAQGKRLFYEQLDMDLAAAYAATSAAMACGFTAPDGREGVSAFLEKRAPRWRGVTG